MTHRNDPNVISSLLTTPARWAMVGLPNNPERTAYRVAKVLRDLKMTVIPVHPKAEAVAGQPGYATLAEIPGGVDVVDIFVNSHLAGAVVDQAIATRARAVWLQLGVIDEAAASRAASAGLHVVMDACPGIEAARL